MGVTRRSTDLFVNNLGNSVFVEKSCLVLGRPRLQTPRIVGLDKSFDLAKVRKNLETPWARFLAAFFETCLAAEDSLVRSGVSPEQMGLLKRQNGVPFLVDAIIDGMTRAGTLDLFRNEMPSIDQLSAKGKRLKDFTANDKRKLENTLTLYVIVYVRKNLSQGKLEGLLYGGRTIKGYDRFVQHDDNINSESITKSAINHYQTAKKFENSEVSSSSHFWSSTVAQKISSIVEQLTVSNDPRNPALFPKFGPKAIRGLDHGLNWSSPVMEMFHEEAGLWTRTLIRDANGNPSYWDFKGPPRKVSRDFTNWEQRSRGAAGSAGNTYTGAGPSRGGRGGGGRGGGRGGAQVTNAFGTMSLGDTRAMPDSHSGQTYSYNKRFRSCNLIQGRAAKPDECCKPIVVTGEDGESLQTCPFCQRLRRLCTFTDGHTLWTNFESKENMWWRGLTLFEPLGQLWKDSLLIGKFKGVETVVYDGAAFDPDDEMEADANVWHASGRTMGGAKEEDEEELDVNKIAKFFDA
ncbi:hypothetical protein CH063_11954 [Colletotrichum higginsianum]|uniref:Uncharacterized protein n=1 Tax=Colletotrichum higginsianum (strain IMI 349063) TaxID=759273 RepID=H1VNH7_COLHI|nr:hypothetical protein CH063_11954 [Colletotrichum higginsianum]